MQKYGFVYIWRDRKNSRFYIGCHWGFEDDGYICSSSWMKQAYERRPQDFRRKILKTKIETKKEMFKEELFWLNMIKKDDFGKKYYNLAKNGPIWCIEKSIKKTVCEKIGKSNAENYKNGLSIEHKKKISESTKRAMGKPEVREKYLKGLKQRKIPHSDPKYRKKLSQSITLWWSKRKECS